MASLNMFYPLSQHQPSFTYLTKPRIHIIHLKLKPKTVRCSSSSPSPFTEKCSVKIQQREEWIANCKQAPPSSRNKYDNDISVQLSELKKLLEALRERRNGGDEEKCSIGDVFLVGTGPGDPDLLTLKALKLIQSADLLLYDRLVSHDILDMVGDNARLLYVGKTAGYHSRTQVVSSYFPVIFF